MLVAVVPYRHRPAQLNRLLPALQTHFDRIVIVEPAAEQPFDRGWVKNVGFRLAHAGPADSVYFHDVDTVPIAADWVYPPVPRGQVLHLYGHQHCLGGIVGVDPAVFELVAGFSHSPRWGGEDRHLQTACEQARVPIDRSRFHARFVSRAVVELNDHGHPESPTQLRAQLKRKWSQASVPAYQPGELPRLSFRLEAQLAPITGPRIQHYIVKK
jgi:hypothetical protein